MPNKIKYLPSNEDGKLVNALIKIEGRELKYRDLCKAVDMPPRDGGSRASQLDKIRNYCQLDTVDNVYPTRYIVQEVYPEADALINELDKDSYQAAFEAALYQIFLKTNCATIYASTSNLLRMFQEVNDNFSYTYSQAVENSEHYGYMSLVNSVIYNILAQWTRRKLLTMKNRYVIDLNRGYRLYKQRYNPEGKETWLETYDVPEDSLDHQTCLSIYSKAVNEIMPPNWGKVIDNRVYKPYVSTEQYKAFEARLAQLTQEAFGGEYVKVKEVYIIKPATKEWIANRLLDVYEHYPSFEKINKEACAKIIQTSQLSCITGKQRREFVDINMNNKQSDKLKDLVASEKCNQ